MRAAFANLFAVPFDDFDLNRRVQIVMRLALALGGLSLVFAPLNMIATKPLVGSVLISMGMVVAAAAFVLARRGRPTLAAWLIIGILSPAILAGWALFPKDAPITAGFFLSIMVVIAGITLRPAQVWLVVALIIAGLLLMINLSNTVAFADPTQSLVIASSVSLLIALGGVAFIGAHVFQRVMNEVTAARAETALVQHALAATNTSLEQRVAERTSELRLTVAAQQTLADELQTSLIAQQQLNQTINDLALPIIPIRDDALIVPLIGIVDSVRANMLISSVLERIGAQHTRTVILDVTGVPIVDTHVAGALLRTANATRLMGVETILVGIRPEVAQALVGLGVELTGLRTAATLQMGLALSAFPQHAHAGL